MKDPFRDIRATVWDQVDAGVISRATPKVQDRVDELLQAPVRRKVSFPSWNFWGSLRELVREAPREGR